MVINEMMNSPEFNRTTRNIADGGIKLFFKHVGTVFSFLLGFVKEMFKAVTGK